MTQIGAAIGREFSHALLAAVVRTPEEELTSALDHVIAAGLLFRQGTPPHAIRLRSTATKLPQAHQRVEGHVILR